MGPPERDGGRAGCVINGALNLGYWQIWVKGRLRRHLLQRHRHLALKQFHVRQPGARERQILRDLTGHMTQGRQLNACDCEKRTGRDHGNLGGKDRGALHHNDPAHPLMKLTMSPRPLTVKSTTLNHYAHFLPWRRPRPAANVPTPNRTRPSRACTVAKSASHSLTAAPRPRNWLRSLSCSSHTGS